MVTGKAVNRGDRDVMQVPCTLHFEGAERFIDILKKDLRSNIELNWTDMEPELNWHVLCIVKERKKFTRLLLALAVFKAIFCLSPRLLTASPLINAALALVILASPLS